MSLRYNDPTMSTRRHPGRPPRRHAAPPTAALLLLALSACSRAPVDPLERATHGISVQRIQDVGRKLAADDMAGRYYASPEAD